MTDVALASEIQRRVGVKTVIGESQARFTTMRVGGPAGVHVVARNPFALRALVKLARDRHLPLTILGRGSNVVVSDRGIPGLVVTVRAEATALEGDLYRADAGVQMARAATESQQAGLTGLEFGLAIPGTVGGAVWGNAGAHDSEVSSVLEWADVLLVDGSVARLTPPELELRYRDSRFKHPPAAADAADPSAPFELVLSATFRLQPADHDTIKARLDDIRRWRRDHQPLGLPSAGSVFSNPPGERSAGWLV
jgi:UDP-N-acetylmuramate dehydrogenase